MKKIVSIPSFASLLIFILSLGVCQARANPCIAKETPKSPQQTWEKSKAEELPEEKISVTHHSIHMDGKILNYTAMAGYLPMKDETGKVKANIFFTPYIKDEEGD